MLRVGFMVVTEESNDESNNPSTTNCIIVNEIIVETERDERDMLKGKKQRYPTTNK